MKLRAQKLTAILAAAALSVSAFGTIPANAADTKTETTAETKETNADDSTGDTDATADTKSNGDEQVITTEDGEAISSDLIAGTFKPSDTAWEVQDSYDFPFLGLKLSSLPKELTDKMTDQTVAMVSNEDWDDEVTAPKYGYLAWCEMTEEQRDAEVEKVGTGYDEWLAGLSRIGVIGMYDADSEKNLDKITGCTEHKELGTSSDGNYKYYLSLNKDADKTLKKAVSEIKTTFTDMAPFQQISVFEQPQDTSGKDVTSVGDFQSKGIDGETYTKDVFSKYDLTLVNIFTTWCSPCVNEIPELEKLYEEMKEKGVGVVGVVLDTVGEDGKEDKDAVKKAEVLQKKTKASYPFLIPDSTMMNGRLNGINAFPETFFVDKNGNIVGETYSGSHDLKEWKEIVEKELANVSK